MISVCSPSQNSPVSSPNPLAYSSYVRLKFTLPSWRRCITWNKPILLNQSWLANYKMMQLNSSSEQTWKTRYMSSTVCIWEKTGYKLTSVSPHKTIQRRQWSSHLKINKTYQLWQRKSSPPIDSVLWHPGYYTVTTNVVSEWMQYMLLWF